MSAERGKIFQPLSIAAAILHIFFKEQTIGIHRLHAARLRLSRSTCSAKNHFVPESLSKERLETQLPTITQRMGRGR